jgi:hypothetical protein
MSTCRAAVFIEIIKTSLCQKDLWWTFIKWEQENDTEKAFFHNDFLFCWITYNFEG